MMRLRYSEPVSPNEPQPYSNTPGILRGSMRPWLPTRPIWGPKNMGDELKRFVQDRFEDGKADLFAAFMYRCFNFVPEQDDWVSCHHTYGCLLLRMKLCVNVLFSRSIFHH